MVNKSKERQAELKDRLREALKIKGMKAADLCEKTGIPKGAISYYLSGKSQPKADRLYTISVALDVSEAWLLGFDVPMERSQAQKKNDDLAMVVKKLRKNPEFFNVVLKLSHLNEEEFDSVKRIVSALVNK